MDLDRTVDTGRHRYEERRAQRWFIEAAYLLLISVASWGAYVTSYDNWDLIGYAGVAYEFLGYALADAHARVYADLREIVSPEVFEDLTSSGRYRATVAADPAAFAQQLPFYRVKPIYPAGMALGMVLGADPFTSAHALSAVFYGLTGILLMRWAQRYAAAPTAALFALLCMALEPVLDNGRLGTPDAISMFVVLLSLWLLVEANRFGAGLAALVCAVLVRPDNAMLAILVLTALAAAGRLRPWHAASGSLCVIAVYVVQTHLSGHYGLAMQFYVSFFEFLPYPADFEISVTTTELLRVYVRISSYELQQSFFLAFTLIALLTLALRRFTAGRRDPWLIVLVSLLAYMWLHFLMRPLEKDRMLTGSYLTFLIVLLGTIFGPVVQGARDPGDGSARGLSSRR